MFAALGLLALGACVGTVGTLLGVGGGFLLVPILASFEPNLPTASLTAVSLGMVAFNAASGTVAYLRQGRVDLASAAPFAIATLPGGVAGAILTRSVGRDTFDLVFAVLLIALAAFLALRPQDAPRPAATSGGWGEYERVIVDAVGVEHRYRANVPRGVGLSIGVGFVASFFGIGGGIIQVPLLVGLLGFPPHIAIGTSTFVLVITATAGTLTHLIGGDLDGLLGQMALLGFGAVVGAQVGARLSRRLRGVVIVRGLAVALVFVGLRLGWQALFAS